MRTFDAFPKTLPTYRTRSSSGGALSLVVGAALLVLVWHELREFLFGEAEYAFAVDNVFGRAMQVNVDLTVAMPCHCGSRIRSPTMAPTLTLRSQICLWMCEMPWATGCISVMSSRRMACVQAPSSLLRIAELSRRPASKLARQSE